MREIVLDTETTGLEAYGGDRLVEIGCVEMVNRILTGTVFHVYINPERDMPVEAFNVHGLSAEFLSDKPKFKDVADDFLNFIAEDTLVIHNAAFDIGFLNAELERLSCPTIARDRVVDTLALARRKHPGGGNRLDDLMNRYGIDSSRRVKHGALLDAEASGRGLWRAARRQAGKPHRTGGGYERGAPSCGRRGGGPSPPRPARVPPDG